MTRVIRVMEVIKSFNVEKGGGGSERFAFELARALDPNRFKILICGLWDYSTPQELERIRSLEAMNIHSFNVAHWDDRYPYRSMLHAVHGLRNVQRYYQANIVNTHSEFADVAILSLWTACRHPMLVRTMHHSLQIEWEKRPLRLYLFSHLLIPMLYTLEIGVSQRLVEQLDHRPFARLFGRKAQLVHNAIDLDRFTNISVNVMEKRRSLGIPANALVVGTIGRLVELKGYSQLIDAASLVIKQDSEVFFLIIGDGELSEQLKFQADQKGVSSNIFFTGGRPDIEELFVCMDLFVSSSYWEALPTVILESMAAGVPIVATDIPGTRELIRDKQNGWLVPPRDASALAQTILVALDDAKSRRLFADNARLDVKQFSIRVIAAEYEILYSRLVQSMPQ